MVAPRDGRAAEGIETYDEYLGPTDGYTEQCYWYDPLGDDDGNTLAMLRNGEADKAVVMRFNRSQLPCFTQWKNIASEACGYVTGLEPATNYPNPKPFERSHGRVVALKPGESYTIELAMEIHDDAGGVAAVQKEIAAIQGDTEKIVHKEPQAGYSDI